MKRILMLLLGFMILTAGCAQTGNTNTETSDPESSSTESAVTESTGSESGQGEGGSADSAVLALSDLLGCSTDTAESLCNTIEGATEKEIMSFEQIPDEYKTVLKVVAEDGKEYYVVITKGYFISEIYEDSLDGERIYRAME